MPRMLDDRLPGIAEKRRELEAWPEKARGGLVRRGRLHRPAAPRRSLGRPHLVGERALLQPAPRPLRAARASACSRSAPPAAGGLHLVPRGVEYVATDILADPVIGLGRGEFYERHVGPFDRVQADGENLPFADGSFDLVYCVASLHPRARRAEDAEGDGACHAPRRHRRRVERGTRAPGASEDNPNGNPRRRAASTSTCTMWAYVAAFLAAGVAITRLEQAEGYDVIGQRRRLRHVLRVPLVGRTAATLLTQNLSEYSGHHRHRAETRVSTYTDVFRYRELFGSLWRRDLEAKYKGTVLGVLWSLANPAADGDLPRRFLASLAGDRPGLPGLFLLTGLVLWVFFANSVQARRRACSRPPRSSARRAFPRQLVPLSSVATNLVAFGVMFVVVLALNFAFLLASARRSGSRSRSQRSSFCSSRASRWRLPARRSSSATSSTS